MELGEDGITEEIKRAVKKTIGRKKAIQLVEAAEGSTDVDYGREAARLKLRLMLEELELVEEQAKELEEQVASELEKTGYAEFLLSIKGIGVVTLAACLELQRSPNGNEYVQFKVAVNKGYGENEHPNFYQCVLFGKAAERIVNAKVRKASLLFITGDLDLVEYTRKANNSKGIIPKITVYDWNYASAGKRTEENGTDSGVPAETEDSFINIEDCGENGLPFN